jgi:heme a synthase
MIMLQTLAGNAAASEHAQKTMAAEANPARTIAKWLLALAIIVAVLILWGGVVRLSGSGLSIPEWPIVNGSLLPPFTTSGWDTVYHTYYRDVVGVTDPTVGGGMEMSRFQRMFMTEYCHRFLAAIVTVLFVTIMILARRRPLVWQKIRGRLWLAAGVLLTQAVIGGLVVKFDLQPYAVALHLGTGFVFLSLLLWMSMKLSRDGQPQLARPRIQFLAWGATHTVLLQVIFGALVAGTGAGLILNTWPLMGSYVVPPLDLLFSERMMFVQFIHRWLAFVAAGMVIWLVARLIGKPMTMRGRIALRLAPTLIALQLLLGIGSLLMQVPFWMAFSHLAVGLWLFITVLVITHETAYAPDHKID